ncbi:MAG: alpha/beta hydrolase [Burkholderiales bacterium]|nr:alpha/beta hydrolase [Burkholderiales bacterium]
MLLRSLLLGTALWFGAAVSGASAAECAGPLKTTDAMIASDTAGIDLFVRRKQADCGKPDPSRVLLYVHGATYPSETAFDLQLDGQSWMDFIAKQGWDVWLVDLRGYGRSTRPPEMERPGTENAPIVTTDVAVRDVGSAVAHVRRVTGADRITLLGWSWGTSIMGGYAARHPEHVSKLVLYAPVWLRTTPSPLAGTGPLPAYRLVARDSAKQRWLNGVPEDKKAGLIPAGWFEAWADATWATDPKSAEAGMLRAPNGVLADLRAYWLDNKPWYDPAKIQAPTLITVAEWDQDTPPYMAQAVFDRLTAAPSKRLVLIGEGTHTIIMEKNRMQLWREVQNFLDE